MTTVVDPMKRERYSDSEKSSVASVGFVNIHAVQDSKVRMVSKNVRQDLKYVFPDDSTGQEHVQSSTVRRS